MPNWIDDDGFNWFNKLRCKRCLEIFEIKDGEIPPHQCIGGIYKSESHNLEYHIPVLCEVFDIDMLPRIKSWD